jgi:hypothetical protein
MNGKELIKALNIVVEEKILVQK